MNPEEQNTWLEEIRRHREARERRLRAADGWLSLVGRFVLDSGENPLPIGTADLRPDGAVVLRPAEGVVLARAGRPVREHVWPPGIVAPDEVLFEGSRRWELLRQGDFAAVRVRDPESPDRRCFAGLPFYPPDPRFRVEGKLDPARPPRTIAIETGLGAVVPHVCPGTIRFTLDERELALDPVIEAEAPDRLFVLFSDDTSRDETYSAGRMLHADPPDATGHVVLDFNKAFNPPCALTPHANCPLPPPQNRLPVRIEAGEKRPFERDA